MQVFVQRNYNSFKFFSMKSWRDPIKSSNQSASFHLAKFECKCLQPIEDVCIQGSAHINKKFCFNLIYVFFSVFVPKFKQIENKF